jgi:hypothetical protein
VPRARWGRGKKKKARPLRAKRARSSRVPANPEAKNLRGHLRTRSSPTWSASISGAPGDGITSGAGAGLDELIGIFDIDRRAWWTLLDASGDVVAVVDDSDSTLHGYGTGVGGVSSPARLCAQFCYDPYGSLLSVQGLHPFPDPRTGHKGLHLDRLDAGVADPLTGAAIARHEVGAEHAYFVRNRHYSPHLGRLLQRDPNATGAAVLGSLASLGRGIASGGASLELATHLTDGVGVYGWLGGEGPWRSSDPLGLFGFNIPDVLGAVALEAGSQAHEMYMELNGRIAESRLFRITTEFGHDSAAYVDWATDWSLDDDLFQQPIVDEEEEAESDEDEFAMGFPSRRAIDGAVDGLRAAKKLCRGHARLGEIIETYAEARGLTRRGGGSIQAHHLVEKRMTKRGQLFEGFNSDDFPAVLLTRAGHQVITNRLRQRLPYGRTNSSKAEVWDAYQYAYRDYPEFLTAIEPLFSKVK